MNSFKRLLTATFLRSNIVTYYLRPNAGFSSQRDTDPYFALSGREKALETEWVKKHESEQIRNKESSEVESERVSEMDPGSASLGYTKEEVKVEDDKLQHYDLDGSPYHF